MATPETLDAFLDESRRRVDEALHRYLPVPPACPGVLSEAMRYSVFAGGKRLRPILTLAAADAVARATGSTPDLASSLALPAACAIELIHCCSLVCDDLPAFDGSPTRHGKDACHVAFGDAFAILAEHALFAHAFALIARQRDITPLDRVTTVVAAVDFLSAVGDAVGEAEIVSFHRSDM